MDERPSLERLGELLFTLSYHLQRVNALNDKLTHIAYEDVVGEFLKLTKTQLTMELDNEQS